MISIIFISICVLIPNRSGYMSSYWKKYLTDNSLFKFGGDRKSVDELTQSLNERRTMRSGVDRDDENVFKHNPYKMIVNDNMKDDDSNYMVNDLIFTSAGELVNVVVKPMGNDYDEWEHGDNVEW